MNSLWLCLIIVLLRSAYCLPQTNSFRMPNVDFSTAQEINHLEPSPLPEVENRSYNNGGNSLEATLEEVQNILKASPDLPRLTRGEILDLLENITKQDMEKLRTLNKNRNGKSVLLVMPYSPKKNGENMEDLFTKKPVTELVDNETTEMDTKKFNKKKKPAFTFKKESDRIFSRNATKTKFFTYSSTPTPPISEITYDTTTPMTTESTTVEVTTFRRRVRPPRTRPPTTTRPTRRRRRTTVTPAFTEPKPDHNVVSGAGVFSGKIDKFLPENAIRVTRPPVYNRFTRRTTTTNVPDLYTDESQQDNIYVNPPSNVDSSFQSIDVNPFSETSDQIPDELSRTGPVFKPISNQLFRDDEERTQPAPTFKPITSNFFIPEGFESILKDLKLDSTLNNQKILEDAIKSNTVFPRITTTTTQSPITPMPEFGEVADNLSPDMKNLLMSFGLIPNPEAEKKVENSVGEFQSQIIEEKPSSYVGFKPIPDEGATNKDLDSLLASFGLGRNARKSKKIKKKVAPIKGLDLSVVPESMMGIVTNLGLKNDISVETNSTMKHPTPVNDTVFTSKNDRIDNIEENENVSAEDIEHINNLHSEIVETVTPLELSNIIKETEENSTVFDYTNEEISTTEKPMINNPELLQIDEFEATSTEPTPENNTWIDIASEKNEENYIVADTETTTKGTLTSVVFNPTDQKIVEKEKEQLDKLVELIKALKRINGSATEEDFKNFDLETLREFTKVLNDSQKSALGEQIENEINSLNNFEDIPKFKPKRQESTTETVTMTPQVSPITESKDDTFSLQESFGQLPEEDIETTTAKKFSSGVYYMIDWNTFLEVDNTKGTHVNLRFQPKVGDPGRFYSINNN